MPYLRTINRQLAEASCTECNTTFTVTRDEDGGAEIETWPCQNDDHAHRLWGLLVLELWLRAHVDA